MKILSKKVDPIGVIIIDAKWIIRESSLFYQFWDFFIIIISIYDCFHIPFIIGFKPSYSETYVIEIIDFIVDFFYLLDILIKFRTTYYAINTQQNSTSG